MVLQAKIRFHISFQSAHSESEFSGFGAETDIWVAETLISIGGYVFISGHTGQHVISGFVSDFSFFF